MKITVIKKRASYRVPENYGERVFKAKTDVRSWAMAVIDTLFADETILEGDNVTLDIRIQIEEAPPCEDKQQKLFDDK